VALGEVAEGSDWGMSPSKPLVTLRPLPPLRPVLPSEDHSVQTWWLW
jgi:hypothetical protein